MNLKRFTFNNNLKGNNLYTLGANNFLLGFSKKKPEKYFSGFF